MSINVVVLSGNLTRDPELRSTPSGMQILQFGLAFNDRRKNGQTGQWEDIPNFVDCTVFGNRAEALSRILTKGMHVAVYGKLRWSSWEKDGQKRSKLEVIADDIDLPPLNHGGAQRQMPAAPLQTPQYGAQIPQGYANPPQQQMPPQMPSQPPAAASPYGNYQPTVQPQQVQPQQAQLYDEDIPF